MKRCSKTQDLQETHTSSLAILVFKLNVHRLISSKKRSPHSSTLTKGPQQSYRLSISLFIFVYPYLRLSLPLLTPRFLRAPLPTKLNFHSLINPSRNLPTRSPHPPHSPTSQDHRNTEGKGGEKA